MCTTILQFKRVPSQMAGKAYAKGLFLKHYWEGEVLFYRGPRFCQDFANLQGVHILQILITQKSKMA